MKIVLKVFATDCIYNVKTLPLWCSYEDLNSVCVPSLVRTLQTSMFQQRMKQLILFSRFASVCV